MALAFGAPVLPGSGSTISAMCFVRSVSVVRGLCLGLTLAACTTGSHMLPLDSATEPDETELVSLDGEIEEFAVEEAPSTTTTTTEPVVESPRSTVLGRVLTPEGDPLPGATVVIGDVTVISDETGWFVTQASHGAMTVSRPAWVTLETEWDGTLSPVTLEPFVVRGIRAGRVVFETDKWDNIISLADQSAVNTIVFDTKDESGQVLYDTEVDLAYEIGAVNVLYDPVALIGEAHDHGLYTITRIVTFEDDVWSSSGDAEIVGNWVDARDEANWAYPVALGVEACELGFDEVQFDYVRFPAGKTGGQLNREQGLTQEIRVGAIQAFLEQARAAINPLGCAVSADVFAIVMSAFDDQGIGQTPEDLSIYLDAISPMIYPSHYGPGWLGFADPNEHNAEVTADALDDGSPRLAAGTLMRPWLQAFYYNAAEILEGINEAEERGFGWMLWNVNGNYDLAALPSNEDVAESP